MRSKNKPSDAFDVLWRLLPHPPGSVVRLFSRTGDYCTGDFAQSAAEIRTFAKTYKGHNIYVAPNPADSTLGTRHTAQAVTHWSFFLVDVDPVADDSDARLALAVALGWLGVWWGLDFGCQPPIIIDSGRGTQAWIRLDDWKCADGKEDVAAQRAGGLVCIGRTIARRANGYWLKKLDERMGVCHGCRIDTSVSDLPRLMRCPGTINIKTGRQARFVEWPDTVFHGLAERLVTGTPKQFLSDPEPPEGVAAGQPWQSVFAHLTRTAQVYLSMGQEEPGRHAVVWHTAKKFQELGVSKEEARKAIRWANTLKGEDSELPHDQVEHALGTAYGG